MKYLIRNSGSMIPLTVGFIVILLFASIGAINVSYLIGERFQLQSELDSLALNTVQQINYDEYFITGFSETLTFDYEQIDNLISTASRTGILARCDTPINTVIRGLTIELLLNCPIALPLPMPGIRPELVIQIGSTARLAQAAS